MLKYLVLNTIVLAFHLTLSEAAETKTVAAIIINFQDYDTEGVYKSSYIKVELAKMAVFYKQSTYGQLLLNENSQPIKVFTVKLYDEKAQNRCGKRKDLAEKARKKLKNGVVPYLPFDLNSADYSVYIFPPPSFMNCNVAGYANSEGKRKMWIFSPTVRTFAHELGHNLGLGHSGDPLGKNNDATCLMGGVDPRMKNFNPVQLDKLGYLKKVYPFKIKTIQIVDDANYISPMSKDPSTTLYPQIYKFTKDGETFYIAYRGSHGVDSTLLAGYSNGLSLYSNKSPGSGSKSTYYGSLDAIFEEKITEGNHFISTRSGKHFRIIQQKFLPTGDIKFYVDFNQFDSYFDN